MTVFFSGRFVATPRTQTFDPFVTRPSYTFSFQIRLIDPPVSISTANSQPNTPHPRRIPLQYSTTVLSTELTEYCTALFNSIFIFPLPVVTPLFSFSKSRLRSVALTLLG